MAPVKGSSQPARSRRGRPAAPPAPDIAARLIDETSRVLATEGAGALTVRRLAAATGTSTMAIYTRFGDKRGLLAATYRAGFERLGAQLRNVVATDDALADLLSVGLAYRAAALANPHLYQLMFSRPIADFEPDATERVTARSAYQPLLDGVIRCLDAGVMTGATSGADADDIARFLWTVAHGQVSLEIAGHGPSMSPPEGGYRQALLLAGLPFVVAAP